jgi:hypothetical protein
MKKIILVFVFSLMIPACAAVETKCDSLGFFMLDCKEYLLGIPITKKQKKQKKVTKKTKNL